MRSLIRKSRGDVHVHIHGASLRLPFDHALPRYVKLFPGYASNVVRVAEAVEAKYPGGSLIDVGANVGDTASFWRARLEAPILAVEGDPHWLAYLTANTGTLPRVSLANVFLGTKAEIAMLRPERHMGTSEFVADTQTGVAIEVCTPGQLLTRFPTFRGSHLIKTDTDGYDYDIVAGFVGELPEPPVFFFEHDPSFGIAGRRRSNDLRRALEQAGYRMTLWWDNFGRFLLASDLRDEALWESLASYVPAPQAAYYWDVAAFPEVDSDLAVSLRLSELARIK